MSTDSLAVQPNTIVWTPVPASNTIYFVSVLDNGLIAAVGGGNRIYTRDQLSSSWSGPVSSGGVQSINVMPSNLLIAAGNDGELYLSIPLGVDWMHVPGSGTVSCVAAAADGSFVGVGYDGMLYTRDTLMSTGWYPYSQQLPASIKAKTVAVLSDGTWACVGTDHQTYLLQNAAWVQYPSGTAVTSVSLLSSNGTETLLASGLDNNLYTTPYPLP